MQGSEKKRCLKNRQKAAVSSSKQTRERALHGPPRDEFLQWSDNKIDDVGIVEIFKADQLGFLEKARKVSIGHDFEQKKDADDHHRDSDGFEDRPFPSL